MSTNISFSGPYEVPAYSKRQCEAIVQPLRRIHNKMWRKAQTSGNGHQKAVTQGSAIALNYVRSVLRGDAAGSAPFVMCRTLFEIVCSVAYLAKQEGELQDFLDFGRMMEDDLGEAFGQAVDPAIQQVRSRLEQRWTGKHQGTRFDKRRQPTWHGHSDSIELAGKVGFLDGEAKVLPNLEYYPRRASQGQHRQCEFLGP